MKRIFFMGSMALIMVSCANSGNGVEHSDSSNMGVESNTPTAGTGDTISRGYGADEHTNNGAGTGTGTGTGAAGAGGSSTGVNAGTGGDSTSGSDTSRIRKQ
jgi:hypothetical protein